MNRTPLTRRSVLHLAAATTGVVVLDGCADGERSASGTGGPVRLEASTEALVRGPKGATARFAPGSHALAITASGRDLFRASGLPFGPGSVNGPAGVAFTAVGAAVVVLRGGEQLLVVDGAGARPIADLDLAKPSDVVVDGERVLVANTLAHRIDVLDGMFAKVGSIGAGVLNAPRAVTVTDAGDIVVADAGNRRLAVFDRNGKLLTTFADAAMQSVSHVRFALGAVHVADAAAERVHVVDLARGSVGSFVPASADGVRVRPRLLATQPDGALAIVGEALA